jgi:hypothetical protein
VSATGAPARRLVAVLLASLVAVLAVVAGPVTAEATPERVSVGNDGAPVIAGPHATHHGRFVPAGLPGDGTTPAGHPGPVLDTLLLAPPDAPAAGGAGAAADRGAAAVIGPGHSCPADPRGPPTA